MMIKILAFGLFFCLIGLLDRMEGQDAELARRQYCQNTSAKLWAQFKTNVNCDEIVGEDYAN